MILDQYDPATPRTAGKFDDEGTAIDAACRIISLEVQLHEARRRNTSPQPATG
jgi:hypothetical protein